MSPATSFRVCDAATRAIAARQIRRLTHLLKVPSVTTSKHTAAQYRAERDQWQQAIDNDQTTGSTR